jgi:hypothetical protein
LIFCSASLFICSFICEYFLNTFASPWRNNGQLSCGRSDALNAPTGQEPGVDRALALHVHGSALREDKPLPQFFSGTFRDMYTPGQRSV